VSGQVVGKERLTIVAAASRSAARGGRADLDASEWILNPEGCAARASLQRELARRGLPLRLAVETYNYELQLALVARGGGLGLVPRRLLRRSPMRRRLRVKRIRGLDFPLTIWLVCRDVPPPLDRPLGELATALAQRLSRSREPA
jgi:DNA-binding transcriptional LysR family regulator